MINLNVINNSQQTYNVNYSLTTRIQALKEVILYELSKNFPDFHRIANHLKEVLNDTNGDFSPLIEPLKEIEKILEESPKYDHTSLLYRLIRMKFYDEALLLIRNGISSIHSKNTFLRESPLHLAAYHGHLDIVKGLIENHADVNVTYSRFGEEFSPLSRCLEGNDHEKLKEVFKLLIAHGANPKIGTITTIPIFNDCIRLRFFDLAELIIDRIDVNATDSVCNLTPLHYAVRHSAPINLIEKLIQKGANVNAYARCEGLFGTRVMTPLHLAVSINHHPATKLLLAAGANPNLRAGIVIPGNYREIGLSSEPLTPFHLAVSLNHRECIDEILHHAAHHQIELNTQFPGAKRTWSDGISTPGYLSTDLRLKTENVKKNGPISGITSPIRCFSLDHSTHDFIRKMFNTFILDPSRLNSARKMCEPLIQVMIEAFKQNPQLAFFCMELEVGTRGCYSPDLGNELVLANNFEDMEDCFAVVMHEMSHKAAHLFYGKGTFSCSPPSDSPFHKALEEDLQHLKDTDYKECDIHIELRFKAVADYSTIKHPSEYFARLAQSALMIALNNPDLTWEDLQEIFKRSIPRLFNFYMQDFLPRCREFTAH